MRQSVTSSGSWCPASKARLNTGLETSLFLGQKAGICLGAGGGSGQACTSQKHCPGWFGFGGRQPLQPGIVLASGSVGMSLAQRTFRVGKCAGQGASFTNSLGLSTFSQHENIARGTHRLCSENYANLQEECCVPDGRMGPGEVFTPNEVDGISFTQIVLPGKMTQVLQ